MGAENLYTASWGGVRMWMSRMSTDHGRSLVPHMPARGDRPLIVQDRGRVALTTRCTLMFDDDLVGETKSGFERFHDFKRLVDAGKPQVLVHPLAGSFLAKIGDCQVETSSHSVISAECTFIADEEARPVAPAGAGTTAAAGTGSVAAAADSVDDELAAVGLESDVPTRAREATDAWLETETVSARQVLVDVADISQRQQDAIVAQRLESDLGFWAAFKASILLSESVRAAGDAATSEVAQVFTMRVRETTSLRALCAAVYGGFESEARYTQVLELNDIRTPGWIPAGTDLVMPQRAARPRGG